MQVVVLERWMELEELEELEEHELEEQAQALVSGFVH
jgi:hypothetical protein